LKTGHLESVKSDHSASVLTELFTVMVSGKQVGLDGAAAGHGGDLLQGADNPYSTNG